MRCILRVDADTAVGADGVPAILPVGWRSQSGNVSVKRRKIGQENNSQCKESDVAGCEAESEQFKVRNKWQERLDYRRKKSDARFLARKYACHDP